MSKRYLKTLLKRLLDMYVGDNYKSTNKSLNFFSFNFYYIISCNTSNNPGSMLKEPWDPLIPEVVMGSPAREEVEPAYGRSLSPMARFAAADPQIMGVLQDIVGSLRGLECRMAALEGRPRPPPAPNERRGEVRPAPAPGARPSRSQRRRMRRRAKRDQPVGPATPAPVRAVRPAGGARGAFWPCGYARSHHVRVCEDTCGFPRCPPPAWPSPPRRWRPLRVPPRGRQVIGK